VTVADGTRKAEAKKSPQIGDENPESATIIPERPQIGRRQERVNAGVTAGPTVAACLFDAPRRRTSTEERTSTGRTAEIAAVIHDEKKKSPRIGDESPESATLDPKWPQIGRR